MGTSACVCINQHESGRSPVHCIICQDVVALCRSGWRTHSRPFLWQDGRCFLSWAPRGTKGLLFWGLTGGFVNDAQIKTQEKRVCLCCRGLGLFWRLETLCCCCCGWWLSKHEPISCLWKQGRGCFQMRELLFFAFAWFENLIQGFTYNVKSSAAHKGLIYS